MAEATSAPEVPDEARLGAKHRLAQPSKDNDPHFFCQNNYVARGGLHRIRGLNHK